MARGKKNAVRTESGVERWLGTALAGLVLAKVALPHRNDSVAGSATWSGTTSDDSDSNNTPGVAGPSENLTMPQSAAQHLAETGIDEGRGRNASSPAAIPAKGWKDVGWRVAKEVKADGVPLLAGGVTYYAMLALFPALIAVVSIYGLVASPAEVNSQMSSLTRAMPGEARDLIITQLTAITEKDSGGLGLGAVISILAALWSASSGMRWVMAALSRAYDEDDNRKFVKMRGMALILTVGAAVTAVVALALLVAMPSIFRVLGLGSTGKIIASILRWPLLAVLVVVGLSVLYRYGPDRDKPKWRWATWGSGIAAGMWLLASVGFSVYASTFGKFDKTYGALGAVIVLMLWLYLSSFAVLVGAEINAELERQTARDTTVGPERPMGQRQAVVADEVGIPKPEKAHKKRNADGAAGAEVGAGAGAR